MKVFISYSDADGLELAKTAYHILESAGHQLWMFEHDKTPGKSLWGEIADAICDSDLVFYICTKNSHTSKGQKREIDIALENGIVITLAQIDCADIPKCLSGDVRLIWTCEQFHDKCTRFSKKLPSILEKEVLSNVVEIPFQHLLV